MRHSPSPAVYYAIFTVTGMGTVLLGILLPQLHTGLSDTRTGTLLAVQFIGQLLGALLVTRRTGHSLTIGIALCTIISFALGLGMELRPWLLFLLGMGLGIAMTATNILAGTEAPPEKRTARLELLNVFWPIGAASCPWLVRAIHLHFHPEKTYLLLALFFVLLLPALLLRRKGAATSVATEKAMEQPATPLHILALCVMGLLAVGTETATASWIPTFSARFLVLPSTIAIATSLFWIGELCGRLVAGTIRLKVQWKVFLVLNALCCAVAAACMAASTHALSVYIAAFLCAFCVAPLYPAVLARCVHLRFRNLVFFSSGIGSAAFPWAVGQFSSSTHSLRLSLMLPVAGALAIAAMLSRETQPTEG